MESFLSLKDIERSVLSHCRMQSFREMREGSVLFPGSVQFIREMRVLIQYPGWQRCCKTSEARKLCFNFCSQSFVPLTKRRKEIFFISPDKLCQSHFKCNV